MEWHNPFKSDSYLCKRLRRHLFRERVIEEKSVKMLRISLADDHIDDYRCSNNRCNRIQRNYTGLPGQDTDQIAKQRHRPSTQDSNR